MDKKQVGAGAIMLGVLSIVLPIFVKNDILRMVGKPVGYTLLFIGVLWIVAGDALLNIFKKKTKFKNMTPEQIIEFEKQKHQAELERLKQQKEIELAKLGIEQVKSKKAKLQSNSSQGKMPDVLGNISGYIKEEPKKKKNDFDLRGLM
jgi:spore germination protein GerM